MSGERDRILQAWAQEDETRVAVPVPEWGVLLYCRLLSAGEVEKLGDDEANIIYRTMIACLVNEDGEPVFTEEDLPRLRDRPHAVIVRLGKLVTDLNGMSEEAQEAAMRDFSETPGGNGSTSSPSLSESPGPIGSGTPSQHPS